MMYSMDRNIHYSSIKKLNILNNDESSPLKQRINELNGYLLRRADLCYNQIVSCLKDIDELIKDYNQYIYIGDINFLERYSYGSEDTNIKLILQVESEKADYDAILLFLNLILKYIRHLKQLPPPSSSQLNHSIEDFRPYIAFIHDHVFYSYDRWRYNDLSSKWKIGLLTIKIYNEALNDAPLIDNTMSIEESTPSLTLQQHVLESFLFDKDFYRNLMKIITIGPNILDKTIKNNDNTIEELIIESLSLLKMVLIHRCKSNIKQLTPMEEFIFKKMHRKYPDIVYSIISYIKYPSNRSVKIPILSTRITILLGICLYRTRSMNTIISHLGRESIPIKKAFLKRLEDKNEDIELRTTILNLISTSIITQPRLSDLFIHYHRDEPDSLNCIKVILDIFEMYKWNTKENRLIYEGMKFLLNLWKNAPKNVDALSKFRTEKKFWSNVFGCLDINDSDLEEKTVSSTSWYDIGVKCCIFEIIASELYFVASKDDLDGTFKEELKKLKSRNVQEKWIKYFTRIYAPPNLKDKLLSIFEHLSINNLNSVVFYSDELYTNEDNFYDIELVKSKLKGLESSEDPKIIKNVKDFKDTLDQLNVHLILNEKHTKAIKSFHQFYHLSHLLYQEYIKIENEDMMDLTLLLVKYLTEEKKGGESMSFYYIESYSLVFTMIRLWANENGIIQESQQQKIFSIFKCLKNVLINNFFSGQKESSRIESIILSCLLILMKSMQKWSHDFSLESLSIVFYISGLIEKNVLKSFSELTNRDKLLQKTSLYIIQTIAMRVYDAKILFPSLHHKNMISNLMFIFNELVTSLTNHDLAESIIYLFISLSESHPILAEALAEQDIVKKLRQESLLQLINEINKPYKINGERNPWHKIWCLCIVLVSRMVRSLGHIEDFVDQSLEFILIHQERIMRLLSYNILNQIEENINNDISLRVKLDQFKLQDDNLNVYTVGTLEETESITTLLFELSNYRYRWRYILDSPYNSVLASQLEQQIMNLFILTIQALVNTKQTRSLSFALSENEISCLKKSEEDKYSFHRQIDDHLIHILRNTISIVRINTPKLWGNQIQDPDVLLPLFLPIHDVSIGIEKNQRPALGHLTIVVNTCVHELKSILKDDPKNPNQKSITLIENIVESSIFIMISHIIMYLSKGDEISKKRVRDEICSEFIASLNRYNKEKKRINQAKTFIEEMEELVKRLQVSARSSFRI